MSSQPIVNVFVLAESSFAEAPMRVLAKKNRDPYGQALIPNSADVHEQIVAGARDCLAAVRRCEVELFLSEATVS